MRRRPHSASSLKLLKQCEYKYFLRYEKKGFELTNDAEYLPFGTAVHRGLEELYIIHQEKQDTEYRFSDEDFDRVHRSYMKSAAEEKLADLNLLQEGWDMIKTRMVNFDYSVKVLGVEKRFQLETKGGTKFAGLIDKVIELDDNTIAVIDYKTSRMALTDAEASTDIQLSLYDLAASIIWPQYENIVVVMDYLRLNPVMSYRTKASRTMFTDWLEETDAYIQSVEEKDIKPSINTFCGTCESRYRCEAYKTVQKDFLEADFIVDGLEDEALVDEWSRLDLLFKAVNSKKRTMLMQLDKIMRRKDGETILGKSKKLYKVQGSRISYNVEDITELLPHEDMLKVCSVNKRALDRYMSDRPDIAKKIREKGSVQYNRPSFNISKI